MLLQVQPLHLFGPRDSTKDDLSTHSAESGSMEGDLEQGYPLVMEKTMAAMAAMAIGRVDLPMNNGEFTHSLWSGEFLDGLGWSGGV